VSGEEIKGGVREGEGLKGNIEQRQTEEEFGDMSYGYKGFRQTVRVESSPRKMGDKRD